MTEKNRAPRRPDPYRLDPEDPYKWPHDYQHDVRTDLMKGLQSVAFLLEWVSQIGNEDLDGSAAMGLSTILRKCAGDAAKLYTLDEMQWAISKAGGNTDTLERTNKDLAEGRLEFRPAVTPRRTKAKLSQAS